MWQALLVSVGECTQAGGLSRAKTLTRCWKPFYLIKKYLPATPYWIPTGKHTSPALFIIDKFLILEFTNTSHTQNKSPKVLCAWTIVGESCAFVTVTVSRAKKRKCKTTSPWSPSLKQLGGTFGSSSLVFCLIKAETKTWMNGPRRVLVDYEWLSSVNGFVSRLEVLTAATAYVADANITSP